jgi:hypothetical protein
MRRYRAIFTAMLAAGTLLAAAGWFADMRALSFDIEWAVIPGHLLQIIGAFGLLLTPDAENNNDTL